ncbi:MAG: hypothetical protein CME26_04170 [Gemmatimonadetes bacterium]|nr:hypothetical protein [Gemmatimonadota bacterium]|tara:strand:+ start:2074 stop:3054 length:981 start_codon:yes stop_codon:yes gene_type:complete
MSSPPSGTPDLEDVAHELKFRREAMGLSVQDLFSRTRINPDFINALEAGDFHVLPEAYVRMFLRKVAQEVGADPDDIIIAYDRAALKQVRDEAAVEPAALTREGRSIWVVAGAASLILIGFVGLVLLSHEPEQKEDPLGLSVSRGESTTAPSSVEPPPQPQPAPATSPTPSPPTESSDQESASTETLKPPDSDRPTTESRSPGPATSDTEETDRVVAAYSMTPEVYGLPDAATLGLTAIGLGTATLNVQADGEVVFDGVVASGRRVSWEAGERFIVDVDRGQDIRLDLLGRPLTSTDGALADENRRVRLYISRASIWVEEIESITP